MFLLKVKYSFLGDTKVVSAWWLRDQTDTEHLRILRKKSSITLQLALNGHEVLRLCDIPT